MQSPQPIEATLMPTSRCKGNLQYRRLDQAKDPWRSNKQARKVLGGFMGHPEIHDPPKNGGGLSTINASSRRMEFAVSSVHFPWTGVAMLLMFFSRLL